MQFGFTNDKEVYDAAVSFRDAAVADGWEMCPTYEFESVESASKLTKDGFHASILTRVKKPGGKWKYEAEVSIWGPDGLCIRAPKAYSMDKIREGMTTCPICNASGVETVRYSFAGRCCRACLPEMQKKHECPGWDR